MHVSRTTNDTTTTHPSAGSSDDEDSPAGGSKHSDDGDEVPFATHGTQDVDLQDVVRGGGSCQHHMGTISDDVFLPDVFCFLMMFFFLMFFVY